MEKSFSIGKEILKSVLKTIIICAIIIVFAGLGFYVINPRFSASVCEKLGWKKAEISCYELLYARNKDTSDLYNLIVKLGNVDDAEKQNEYIDKIQALETYKNFCDSMDNSVLKSYLAGETSAKNLGILYGTNEYISSREIINLLSLEKYDSAYALTLDSRSSDGTYELVVYHYVEYLYAQNISTEIKANYFEKLKTDFNDYLSNKEQNLPAITSTADSILKAYTQLRIDYVQYIIAFTTSAPNASEAEQAWRNSQEEYNSLINA